MPKVYDALLRVSKMNGRQEEADSTMTLDNQRREIRRVIEARGGKVGREFKATDQSGWTVYESSAWREALARVERKESAGWAIAYDDRLGRNWRKAGRYYDEAEEAGAEIIMANLPGVDYRSDDGRTLTGILAVVAERQYLGARKRGNEIADTTMARLVPNRVPYGYRRNAVDGVKTDPERDAKALVPDERTAAVVVRIFELRRDGYSWAQIGDTFEAAGVLSPSGAQRWTRGTLQTLVVNEAYLGVLKLGERRIEDAHKPLVSSTLWRAAQSSRTISRTGRLRAGVAAGVLVCSSCGCTLSLTAGTKLVSYGCRRDSKQGKCERPVYVIQHAADAFVNALMVKVLTNTEQGYAATARELKAAREAVGAATAERKRWSRFESKLDDDDFLDGYAERQRAEREAIAVYEDLASRADEANELPVDEAGWQALDIDHQRRVARNFIDRIRVKPPLTRSRFADVTERFEVRWHSAGPDDRAGR